MDAAQTFLAKLMKNLFIHLEVFSNVVAYLTAERMIVRGTEGDGEGELG